MYQSRHTSEQPAGRCEAGRYGPVYTYCACVEGNRRVEHTRTLQYASAMLKLYTTVRCCSNLAAQRDLHKTPARPFLRGLDIPFMGSLHDVHASLRQLRVRVQTTPYDVTPQDME